MLNFRKIELEDREVIEHFLRQAPYHQINCSFDVFYIWRNVGNVYFATTRDLLFIQGRDPDGSCWYFFPFGKGDLAEGIRLLWEDYLAHREERALLAKLNSRNLDELPCYFRIVGARKEQFEGILANVSETIGVQLISSPKRDLFEYVYQADHFRGFKGKALQSKRNFVNFARKNYAWEYESIQPQNLEECKNFVLGFGSADVGFDADTFVQDQGALMEALKDYSKLNLYGGIIRIDGHIEALFMGSPLSDFSTMGGLFMRVNHAYKGLAPLIFEEILTRHSEYAYLNLDADVGQEGLRKNKLSYLPDHLVEIYEIHTIFAPWRHYRSIDSLPRGEWKETVGKDKIWQDEALYRISEKMGAGMHYLIKRDEDRPVAACAFTQQDGIFSSGSWETCDSGYWYDPSLWKNEKSFQEEGEMVLKAYLRNAPDAEDLFQKRLVIEWEDSFPSSYIQLPEAPENNTPEALVQAYVSGLKSKYRNDMRKYLQAFTDHHLSWEIVVDFIPLLNEFYPLYLETVSRASEYKTEAYPPEYFTTAKEVLGDRARMLCLRDSRQKMIGFMLLYFGEKSCVMQYTGSSQNKEMYPWHLMTIFSIVYAWSQKIRVIHLGITHFEGKKQFGTVSSLD